MKKIYLIIFSFLTLFISIFFINNVSAMTDEINYDYQWGGYSYTIEYDGETVEIKAINNNSSTTYVYPITKENFAVYWWNNYIRVVQTDEDYFYINSSNQRWVDSNGVDDFRNTTNLSGGVLYMQQTNGFDTNVSTFSASGFMQGYQTSGGQAFSTTDVRDYSTNSIIYDANFTRFTPGYNYLFKWQDGMYFINSTNIIIANVNANVTPSYSKTIYCYAPSVPPGVTVNRPFDDNRYCDFYYSDFDNTMENNLSSSFIYQLQFDNDKDGETIKVENNKYYSIMYRVMGVINPLPSNIQVEYSDTSIYGYNLVDVLPHYAGSYTDYQLVFKAENVPSNVTLKNITIFNNQPLSYYTANIDDDFSLGIYYYYKFTTYDNEPTSSDLEDEYRNLGLDIGSDGDGAFFNRFTLNQHGLSSILTIPLRLIRSFVSTTSNADACTPLTIPFPHSNSTITIPCMREYLANALGNLFTIFQLIVSGFICYRVGIGYFRTIKELQNPSDDKIEVVDL